VRGDINMLKMLRKKEVKLYWIDDKGVKHKGCHAGISGDLSGISGDLSGISGDVSGIRGNLSRIRGNLSGIRGNLSGISGDLSGISGDVDDCEITDTEREKGIKIEDLIQ
jgi:hypothetical protein